MDYKKSVLDNGLRVITVNMPGVESATATVWVRTGSRFEDKRTNGISHFLEHLVFKGSKTYPSAKELSGAVESLGGIFNASTSKEWTNFYIKVRSDVAESALTILSDMVLYPLMREEDLATEKGVITEEIAMYEDTPQFKIGDIFERIAFQSSPLGMDITGTKDSVNALVRQDFLSYRETHYYPENMVVTIAGGVKHNKILGFVKKAFFSLSGQGKAPEKPQEVLDQASANTLLVTKKSDQAHLELGWRGHERGNPLRYTEALLATVLGGGMSSRLFSEVREKRGLAYAISSSTEHYIDTGYLSTYAGVKIDAIYDAVAVILEEHRKIAEGTGELADEEIKRAKEYLKGKLALSLEDTSNVNTFFGVEELLLGMERTPEEVYRKIDEVTKEDLTKMAREMFVKEKLNLAVIGPYTDEARFAKLVA